MNLIARASAGSVPVVQGPGSTLATSLRRGCTPRKATVPASSAVSGSSKVLQMSPFEQPDAAGSVIVTSPTPDGRTS